MFTARPAAKLIQTRHSHVNAVVIDSGWEGRAAKVLDDLYEEGHVVSWVKNAFLDFHVPYTDIARRAARILSRLHRALPQRRTAKSHPGNFRHAQGQGAEEMDGHQPLASRRQSHPRATWLGQMGFPGNRQRSRTGRFAELARQVSSRIRPPPKFPRSFGPNVRTTSLPMAKSLTTLNFPNARWNRRLEQEPD